MCTIQKTKVKWTIDKPFLDKIKSSLLNDKHEVAGSLLFTDYDCKDGVCNKKSSKFTLVNGNGTSVMTPRGIINYHTHPIIAYRSENAVYGWPSGEDMTQCINFAKDNTLVHIVFSLEGAYIIHIKNILKPAESKLLERLFKQTHIFRSEDQTEQLKDFKNFMKNNGFNTNSKTTLQLWLRLANNITTNKLFSIFNKNKQGTDDKIFEVKLINITNKLTFDAYYITEMCHTKSFGKNLQ